MADNTRFDMTAVRTKPAMEIAFANAPVGKATHWKHDKENNRIILAWSESAGKDYIPFLAPVTAEQAVELVQDWIKVLDFGTPMDHDGDSEYSFRLYCEDWGLINHNQYAFAAISPAWAHYGK